MKKWLIVVQILIFTISSFATTKESRAEQSKAFEFAARGPLKKFKKIISTSTQINQTNENGESLLMTAAGNGQLEIVKYLISKNANLVQRDKGGKTALYYAIVNEQPAAARLLIAANAPTTDLNEINDSALILAVSLNDAVTINSVLDKNPNLINLANAEKKTPLMEAARHGSAETIKLLLSKGADKNAKNDLNKTALDIAKKAQNKAAIRLLSN